MRFFVAKGAPQNDGGFWWRDELWRRFALIELAAVDDALAYLGVRRLAAAFAK
jgi:hypothetical protein